MNNKPFQAYQNNSVQTASPGELTLLLYNGCLKFIKLAKKGIEGQDIEAKNINIQKAQNIINELMITLNMDFDVSKQMLPLYDYIHHRLVQANLENDLEILEEVEDLVNDFRDTWKEIIRLSKQQKVSGNV